MHRARNIETYVLGTLIIGLLLFSPAFQGGSGSFSVALIESCSVILLFATVLLKSISRERFLIPSPSWWLAGLVALGAIQLLPLPSRLVSFISPSTAKIYNDFSGQPGNWLPLSLSPNDTYSSVLLIAAYLSVFLSVYNFCNVDKRFRLLAASIILICLGYSFYGLMHKEDVLSRAFSTFVNRTHFAAYLGMAAFFSLGFALSFQSILLRVIFTAFSVGLFSVLPVTSSRGGLISAFISGFVFCALSLLPHKGGLFSKLRSWSIYIVVALVLAAVAISLMAYSGKAGKIAVSPISAGDVSGRIGILKDSLNIAKDFPLLGTGLGAFRYVIDKYKLHSAFKYKVFTGRGYAENVYKHEFAHNEPVQLLVEGGVLGLIMALIAFLLYAGRNLALFTVRHNQQAIFLASGVFAALFCASFHSFVDFIFHVPAVTVLFCCLSAMLPSAVNYFHHKEGSGKREGECAYSRGKGYFAVCAAFLLAFFVTGSALRNYIAEGRYLKADPAGIRLKVSSPEWIVAYIKRIAQIDDATRLNPRAAPYYARKADLLAGMLKSGGYSLLSSVGKPYLRDRESLIAEIEGNYKKAIAFCPADYDTHFKLGLFYEQLGMLPQMAASFRNALALDPRNIQLSSYVSLLLGQLEEISKLGFGQKLEDR